MISRLTQKAAGIGLIGALFSAPVFSASFADHQSGTQFSSLDQINASNVANLELAWEFHTGDLPPEDLTGKLVAFEDQPTLVDGNLMICSTKRKIFAIDPATGKQRWMFDPKDPLETGIGMRKCRGISHWVDKQAEAGAACASRILLGTADYRLLAIDAKTGKPCEGFGEMGEVDIPIDKPEIMPGEVIATSHPAVINDVIVVGSSVADNQRVKAPSGRVMAYHARTGKFLWQWDPVPRDASDPAMKTWKDGTKNFGQGNVWSSMAVDEKLDMVYLPTTSTSSDFYGGERVGDNNYTTSVVALKASTGEIAWHFQVVHHNVFDYDIPARPMLIDYPKGDEMVPALLQNTKMGLVFIFDRETGEPLVPIEERPVPQEGFVKGEVLSPTQPFPVGMPALVPQKFDLDDVWGFTPIDRHFCKKKVEGLNYGPIYTPPSEKGTVFMPSAGGGPNWGSGGYDPKSNIMVVPVNRMPMIVKLTPREKSNVKKEDGQNVEGLSMTFDVLDSPYIPTIEPLMSSLGTPCSAPPWASLVAVDIVKKEKVWEVPLGGLEAMMPFPIPFIDTNLGMPGAGGPLVTAGGVVFIGYSIDDVFRAHDLKTGKELWRTKVPAAAVAVPVTYEVNGEQYIVIATGGHSMFGSTLGDSVVAYKLKK
ncbi:pyrroloquinoline quinone-dependent dehydrogenase [Litorivivens sp.]|uniref:pyrroloquinoline quinone-dependent dehydrogenase n=1 Tax=Litorivivens sp. TaxID=2020868 RepID=UPI003562C370